MTEKKVEPDPEPRKRFDKTKKYMKDNWKPIAIGAGVTAVTIGGIIVTKKLIFPSQTSVLFKKIVIKDSVLLIKTFNHQQGPPSWMVRSGDQLWRSQEAAAKAVGVSSSTMSRHLNGVRPHINGRVFERVAIEVGHHG